MTLGSWQLVYIPMSIIAGIAMDKWGIRKTMFAGALMIALSEGLRYFATGFVNFMPMVALFGIGGPLISIGAPKAVFLWFKGNDRATAVGIYTTAPWIGGLFAIAATNSLIMPLTGQSWRLTFALYSVFALLCAFVWWLFARDTRASENQNQSSIWAVFLKLIKLRNVKIILIAGLLVLFIDHGFSNWLPTILEKNGLPSNTAGIMASIPLLVAIPAVLFLPRFVPRHLRARLLAGLAFLTTIVLVISSTTSSWTLITALVIYGIGVPALLPMLMLMIMDEPQVDSGSMGLIGGIFFAVAEIGGFTGPLLMGFVVDRTGTFLMGAAVIAGAGLLLGFLMFLLREPRQGSG